MNNFPILETERFILRQLRLEDAPDLFSYFSKDEVTEFYDLESFTEVGQAEELIKNWNDRFTNAQGIRWGITFKHEDRIIGTCGFHNWSKEHFKIEVGYELSPPFWRQGIMTEVLKTVINYGFSRLGLNRIEAFIDPHNISSRKLLQKVGLTEEGTLRDYFYEKSKFVDAVIFSILKQEHMEGDLDGI